MIIASKKMISVSRFGYRNNGQMSDRIKEPMTKSQFQDFRARNVIRFLIGTTFSIIILWTPTKSFALGTSDLDVSTSVGNIDSIAAFFIFTANLLKYLGWSGVVIGLMTVIGLLTYKVAFADDSESIKKVQGGITKAIIIVFIGLLILSAGFIVNVVSKLFGMTNDIWLIPPELR